MILLTGAAGMSGREIFKVLTSRSVGIRALVRNASRAASLGATENAEVVCADMSRPSTLGPALEGVKTALLISSADERMQETQCRFVDAAKAAGVPRIVKFSGQEAGIGFDPSAFRFTRMHEEIERYIERSGLRWTHFRPSQFMQVYLREAPSIARGVLVLPLGEVEMAPVDILDVARIASAIAVSDDVDSKAFQITGPQALTMHQVAEILSRAIGRPVSYRPVSVEERSRQLLAVGAPAVFVAALQEQAVERLRHPRAALCLATHEAFDVEPTTFATFAARHAAILSGQVASPGLTT